MAIIRGTCDNGRYILECEYSYSQNISTNQSTVTAVVYLNGNGYSTYSKYWSCVICGVLVTSNKEATVAGRTELGRHTWTITHNPDGTCTTNISFSYDNRVTPGVYTTKTGSGSANVTLSTIPRASVIGALNFSNFWSNFNVTYTKYYAGFTCKLRVSYPTVSIIQTFDNYGSGTAVTFSSANQNAIMKELISGSVQLGFVIETWSGGTKIGESEEKIITISKPTVNQITNVSDFNVDSGFTVETSKAYPSYASTINVIVAGVTVFIASNISNNYKVTFSSAQLNQIYTAMKTVNSATFTITITSFYGSSDCGNVSVNRMGTITNASPTLPGFSWQTINNLTLHDNQTIIKGKSNVKVSIQQATAFKGAAISYYQVTIGSVTSKVETLEATLNNCDGKEIEVKAVDSRNNVTTKQLVCPKYIEYTSVTLEGINYVRGNGGIGSDVTIDFSGSMFVQSFGLQSNTITATYYFKEVSGTTYTEGTTVITPIVKSKYSNTVNIKGDLNANGFSIDKNFNLKVTVNDKLTSYTREIVIAKGTPAIAIHENGVSFGGFYDEKVGGNIQTTDIVVAGNKVGGVLGYKHSLGMNVNLNTITTEGYYHQGSSSYATIALNYPTTMAGLLTVINRSYIYQTYQTITGNSDIYFRSYYNGTWYPWKKAVSTDVGVIANMTNKGGYLGFDDATGGYLRTPPNGLLPNVSGASSYVGSESWRFIKGWFQHLNLNGDIHASQYFTLGGGWYRSLGSTGWYNETFGGGIYMKDKDYVRVYQDKHFLTGGELHAGGAVYMGGLRCMRTSDGHIDAMGWGNASRTYIHVSTSQGAYGINVWASDKTLKEHIRDSNVHHALDKIGQLHHVSFDWKEDNAYCELGYVADDMEKILPCLIHEVEQEENEETGITPKPLKHINHTTLIPLVTMGMQELMQENNYLWEFNNAVVEDICNMKKEIEKLKIILKIESEVR